MKRITVLVVVLLLMSSCAAPVETTKPVSTELITTETLAPTDTPVSTATYTPEPTSTPTVTPTPAPTSIPVYTELGELTKKIAEVLGWQVVICDDTVVEEDWDKGVFLYREDTADYFCGFEGHTPEPIPEPTEGPEGSKGQYLLVLYEGRRAASDLETITPVIIYGFYVRILFGRYIESPSECDAYEIMSIWNRIPMSPEDIRNAANYLLPLRLWPLTEEEYIKIKSDSFLNSELFVEIRDFR